MAGFRVDVLLQDYALRLREQSGQDCRMARFRVDVLLQDYALRLREQPGQDCRMAGFLEKPLLVFSPTRRA
jgi:hypothetical protein